MHSVGAENKLRCLRFGPYVSFVEGSGRQFMGSQIPEVSA